MFKLSDQNYRLPQIEALSDFGVMDTGTTEPMGIRGVDIDTGIRGQFVVKYINSSRMSAKSSCRELLGCWMARELEITVVEPVLVNISEAFVGNLIGKQGYQSALKSIGLNYGSVYEAGYNMVPNSNFALNGNLIEQAKTIFMFDMFIANADRGAGKPNVLSNGENLLVFDHELAFSFVDIISFLRNPKPWTIGAAEQEMYEKHYFYPYFRKQEIDFTSETNKLTCFNHSFWDKAFNHIPEEWKTDELNEIKNHLDSIIENKSIFAEQLTKIILA